MKDLIKTKQLAKILGIHPVSVHKMTRAGKIPYIRLSARDYRYDLDEVMNALRESTAKGVDANEI